MDHTMRPNRLAEIRGPKCGRVAAGSAADHDDLGVSIALCGS